MLSLRICILFATLATCIAQPTRLEILSRSDDHTRRQGASSMAALPEFSRDGNFVLFVSAAPNVTTNGPSWRSGLNLYMTDRRTHQTTLISAGPNGEPANDSVVNFEISANNRRVLFETAASNLIANDTNNASDVFIRDLDLNQTILVSANTNGVVSRRGAANATMSADGNRVVFTSADKSFVAEKSTTSLADAFVRDISTGTTDILKIPDGYLMQNGRDPVISDDGRRVAFTADVTLTNSLQSLAINVVCDLSTHSAVRIAEEIPGNVFDPLITPDGKFVTFGIQNGFSSRTNVIVRYSVEDAVSEMVVSNSVQTTVRPVAISADGGTILYLQDNGYRVYRSGLETRIFPRASDGTPIALPATFGMAAISADGRLVTFSTEVPLLPDDPTDGETRTYVYDVNADSLAEIPTNVRGEPVSNPVPNADGSFVVFTALSGLHEPGEPAIGNIYIWDRNSGAIDLVSQSHLGAFENSDRGESKLSDRFAISDDGTKVAFQSRTPSSDVVDTNGTWDVFVLDRSTGRKQLVSVASDGASSGSHASTHPIISGDGRVVAFISRATNLVDAPPSDSEQLYVRDLDSGVTRLVANTNGLPAAYITPPDSLSLSRDGRRLAFCARAFDFDNRAIRPHTQIFVYDLTSNEVSLVTYDSTGAHGAFGDFYDPAISPDGARVAFRGISSSFGFPITYAPWVRTIDTGAIRPAPAPSFTTGTTAASPATTFSRDSSVMFYRAPSGYFLSWDFSAPTYKLLATSCADASASDDGRWVAVARHDANTFPPRSQIYLRDTVAGKETMITTNATSGTVGNLTSTRPQITSDGRFVVFQSRATNLVANDNNGTADIFMFDRDTQRLDLVSAAPSGGTANGASLRPIISPDDSFVAFVSFASDLIGHDYNDGSDIFAAYFPAPDSDGDGINDRWEMAQFGSLTHDMSADTDGDGMSDAEEFAAGTNPQQADSTLRVTGASTPAAETIVVRWAATPGRSYRVQARSKLDQSSQWQDVSDAVMASQADSALEIPLPVGASELYFRIVSVDSAPE